MDTKELNRLIDRLHAAEARKIRQRTGKRVGWPKGKPRPEARRHIPDDLREQAEAIITRIAQEHGIPPHSLIWQGRKAKQAMARKVAMRAVRRVLGLSYPSIGELFGGRHHTTVMSACKGMTALPEAQD